MYFTFTARTKNTIVVLTIKYTIVFDVPKRMKAIEDGK